LLLLIGDTSAESNHEVGVLESNDIKSINEIGVGETFVASSEPHISASRNIQFSASRNMQILASCNVQISDRVASFRDKLKRLENEKDKFMFTVQSVEEAIKGKAEEIKQLVDTRVTELTIELRSFQAKNSVKIEKRMDKLRAIIKEMEAFEAYCTTQLASGSGSLSDRDKMLIASKKLLETNVDCDEHQTPDIVFVPDDLCEFEKTVFGKILTGV